MHKNFIVPVVIASFASFLLGCTADSSTPISVETVESDVQLRMIAPGVSEGEHGNQHVVYVSDRTGADWLADTTLREYNGLLARYNERPDASLLPRLTYLQSALQVTGDGAASSFVIASSDPASFSGPTCSGGGSTCVCGNGCTCIARDEGCACGCSPHKEDGVLVGD